MVDGVVPVAWNELAASRGSGLRLLGRTLAIRASGFVSEAEAAAHAASVYAARSSWNADFGGEQFSLGRAWYTHLEEERSEEYFASAAASNALVEASLPGLAARMVDAIARITGVPAQVREGWCGPGVHVFPAGEHVALHGGVVHFDTEGLTEAQLEQRTPAVTLVLMLQRARRGGGLRVWDELYDGEDVVEEAALAGKATALIDYAVGELLVLDSYRLHQIQPFDGPLDRISMTAHAALGASAWDVWF